MYEVDYNCRTYYVSCIRPEGLLYDTERNLLATAKFLVKFIFSNLRRICSFNFPKVVQHI